MGLQDQFDYSCQDYVEYMCVAVPGFSNGASRSKLCERVQQMQLLYDRCVLIVEKDRVKPGEEKNTRPP